MNEQYEGYPDQWFENLKAELERNNKKLRRERDKLKEEIEP